MQLPGTFSLTWWQGDSVAIMKSGILDCRSKQDAPYMATFKKRAAVVNVYLSNLMEGTLPPSAKERDTYKLVELELDSSDGVFLPEPALEWAAEGHHSSSFTRAQLLQYARAQRYLNSLQELSSEAVQHAHKIMMWGATGVSPGVFRSQPAHSGTGYVYPEAELIPNGVEQVLSIFRRDLEKVHAGELDVNIMTARLFYKMITLHPFKNGNGRLCRLLASFALRAAGDPFLVCLTNGRKKARQHYQQVLRHADTRGDIKRLAAYILECRHFAWQNFARNLAYATV
jgi:fido (protein-threonine AMPylation protein)